MVIKKSDKLTLDLVIQSLKQQELVIAPCDTIYGFLGSVPNSDALIRKIKGRNELNPFLRLINSFDISTISDFKFPKWLYDFWPGALTVIVPLKKGLRDVSGVSSVALRFPDDKWLCSIIEGVGGMIYSTSVNRSGNPPMNDIDKIVNEFQNEVSLIVDQEGPLNGLPSTLLDFREFPYEIRRSGAVDISSKLLNTRK